MAAKQKRKKKETDGEFFLKLVLYLLVSSFWIKIVFVSSLTQVPIPIGLGFALIFASREHFQIDRKIEYAVILIGVLVGFWSNSGLLVAL